MKTIYLVEPVTVGSNEISELKMRKPKGKDFKKLPVQMENMGQVLDWAARLCDEAPSTFDELCAEDVMQIMECVSDFLPNAPGTGGD